MALTLVSLLITAAICYATYYIMMWHMRRQRLYKMASKFEGPPVLPFVGNAHSWIGNGEHLLKTISELCEKYPSPFRLWMGPRLFVFTTEPEHLKTILLSPKALGKGVVAEFGQSLAGEGLFTAPVAKWKVHRKLIQPTFSLKILDSFVEIFVAQSKIFTEKIAKNLDGPEFEILHLVGACALDMICETAMGVKMGAQENTNCSYFAGLHRAVAIFGERFCRPWLHPDIIFYNTQIGKEQLKHIKFVHDFTDNVIRKKRAELLKRKTQPGTADDEDDARDSTPRKEAFLDHFMKLTYDNVSLSDKELRDEVNTIVMAGNHEATLTFTHVLFMLASHPDVQGKVYQELFEIYGSDDIDVHPVTSKDLPRLKYLERAIKETMRLFPVTPLLIRAVTEDLDIGDYTIPSGSSVAMGVLSLHRNEKYWPDPLKFDPDRFLPEEVAKRHPYTYMAFGGGPRNCPGFNYAMMSMKTLAATILRRYVIKKDDIVPVKDIRLKVKTLVEMVDPVTIRIERRNKN